MTRIIAGLAAVSLLTIGADDALARGGYFSAGNPGGLRGSSGYQVLQTPANQASEWNKAWTNYNAQGRQAPTVNIPNGNSHSTMH
jgi:flagellar basal body rod protein FlgG